MAPKRDLSTPIYLNKMALTPLKKASLLKRISSKFLGRSPSSERYGQTIPKGDITMLVIKGGDIQVELEGKDSDKLDVHVTGSVVLSKKKTCLIVTGDSDDRVHGKIIVPNGVRVVLEGGVVQAKITDLIADMEITAGRVAMTGHGKISRLQVFAGQAKMDIQGVMGQTLIHCGQGDIQLTYALESWEKMDGLEIPQRHTGKILGQNLENPYVSSGLHLHQPAVRIKVHLASGHAELFFPPHSAIGYPKEAKGVRSFVRHQSKRPAFRITPYLVSPAASMTLRIVGDNPEAQGPQPVAVQP